jgi:hypothetical protein
MARAGLVEMHKEIVIGWNDLIGDDNSLKDLLVERRPEEVLVILESLLREKPMSVCTEQGGCQEILYTHWQLLYQLKKRREAERSAKRFLRYLRQRKMILRGEAFLKELATSGERAVWVDQFRMQFLIASDSFSKIGKIFSKYRKKLSAERFNSYLHKLLDNPLLLADITKYLIHIERSVADVWEVTIDIMFSKVEAELKRSGRSDSSSTLLHLLLEYIALFPEREKGHLKTILYAQRSGNDRLARGAAKVLDSKSIDTFHGDRRGDSGSLLDFIKNAISMEDDPSMEGESIDLGDDLFAARDGVENSGVAQVRKLVRDFNFLINAGRKEAAVLVLTQIKDLDSGHPVLEEFRELLDSSYRAEYESEDQEFPFFREDIFTGENDPSTVADELAMRKSVELMPSDELVTGYRDIHAALFALRMWSAIDLLLHRVEQEINDEAFEIEQFNVEYLKIINLFSVGNYYAATNAAEDALFDYDLEVEQQVALAYIRGESWWKIGKRDRAYQIFKMILSKYGYYRLAKIRVVEFEEN